MRINKKLHILQPCFSCTRAILKKDGSFQLQKEISAAVKKLTSKIYRPKENGMKKTFAGKLCLAVLAAALCLTALAACGGNGKEKTVYYTVRFVLDGGEIAGKDVGGGISVKKGTELKLSDYIACKQGYTFIEWQRQQDIVYAPDATLKVDGDMTLTARWQRMAPATYTVRFELNGGAMGQTEVTVTDGDTLDLSKYIPYFTGHVFDGWRAADGTLYKSGDAVKITGNLTLSAAWTPEETPKELFTFAPADDGLSYILTGVTGEFKAKTLSVPALYGDKPVSRIAAGALAGCDFIETFMAGENIVGMGAALFADCVNLKSLTLPFAGIVGTITAEMSGFEAQPAALFEQAASSSAVKKGHYTVRVSPIAGSRGWFFIPESLTSITVEGGELTGGAFADMKSLTSVTLKSEAITALPANVFDGCAKLQQIDISRCVNLETVGNNAFRGCYELTTVSFKNLTKLKTIGDSAFYGNYNAADEKLTGVSFEGCESLESIGQMAFAYQDRLVSLDFKDCVELRELGRQIFDHCTALKTIVLPTGLQTLGSEALRGCDALQSISISALNLWYACEQGVLFDKDKTEIYKYPAAAAAAAFTAPASLKKIAGQAFAAAVKLTVIDLSACALQEIGFQAFAGCVNARLTVSFDRYGYNRDGSEVKLDDGWADGAQVIYAQDYLFFVFDIKGLSDGMKTDADRLSFTASARYGADDCQIEVRLNSAVVTGDGVAYTVTLNAGENVIGVKASFSGKDETVEFTVIYEKKAAPTVTTTLQDGKVYSGDYLEFEIEAKDGAGKALPKSAVTIKTNWGYGLNDLNPSALETTEVNGKIKVKINFALLWRTFTYEGGRYKMVITVTAGDASVQIEYTLAQEEAQ